MQLNTIQKSKKVTTAKPRVGRGGKRGKTSGHGHKGQKQHGGHGIRPEMRDFLKKLPKLRGHGVNRSKTVNSGKPEIIGVNMAALIEYKLSGEITPKILVEAGIVKKAGGKLPKIKILGGMDTKTKFTVSNCTVSTSAKEAIEKAGGVIQ